MAQDDEYRIETLDLGPDDCWRLLASAEIGRLAFVGAEGPVAIPVNCAVHEHRVIIRTSPSTSWYGHRLGEPVAVEADHTDHVAQSGWSVIVKGHLWEIDDERTRRELRDLPLRSWVAGDHDVWLEVVPAAITGRITSRSRVVHGPGISRIPPD